MNSEIKKFKIILFNENNRKKNVKNLLKKKNFSIGRAMSIVKGAEKISGEIEQKIWEIKEKIEKITKMDLKEYIDYKNGKDKQFEKKIILKRMGIQWRRNREKI